MASTHRIMNKMESSLADQFSGYSTFISTMKICGFISAMALPWMAQQKT